MSQFTDYAENKLADFMRGQTLTLPASWFFALGSAATDVAFTEIAVTGYARTGVARSLANFCGTQGAGTTTASSGTSHATQNNVAVSFGSPSGSAATANVVGIFDASTNGNCWAWVPLDTPISVGASAPVSLGIGAFGVVIGASGGCSDYLANKLVDLIFRAQAFAWPTTLYLAAYTAAPTNAGGGTEVAATGYARATLAPSLTSLSGTQAAGSTAVSSGTTGTISNNAAIAYPTPSVSWGSIVGEGIRDAATLGNLLFWGTFAAPKSVGVGAPLTHAVGSLSISIA